MSQRAWDDEGKGAGSCLLTGVVTLTELVVEPVGLMGTNCTFLLFGAGGGESYKSLSESLYVLLLSELP